MDKNTPLIPAIERPRNRATGYITIPLEEYAHLQRMAAMLDVIMHDHTAYREAVPMVKNVLIAHGLHNEAGVEE
jgi:hypothetical protein